MWDDHKIVGASECPGLAKITCPTMNIIRMNGEHSNERRTAMALRFGCLLAAFTLLPLAGNADEIRSATIDGFDMQAVVGQPTQKSSSEQRQLLERASEAPPASAVYRPPQTPAEAAGLVLPRH